MVADQLVEAAGIHPVLHRFFAAPIMDGDIITGIITESKAGHAATRNMNCCAVTGQDTGIAAALSLKTNKALERIDIAQL